MKIIITKPTVFNAKCVNVGDRFETDSRYLVSIGKAKVYEDGDEKIYKPIKKKVKQASSKSTKPRKSSKKTKDNVDASEDLEGVESLDDLDADIDHQAVLDVELDSSEELDAE
jgi:hypothetical protein